MKYINIDSDGNHKSVSRISYVFQQITGYFDSKQHKTMVLIIVFIALVLDNMLLTVIVPIIPDYLWQLDNRDIINQNCTVLIKYQKPDWTDIIGRKHVAYDEFEGPEIIEKSVINNTCVEELKNRTIQHLSTENMKIGLMFASKPVIQLLTNPIVGPITNRIGYSIPMFFGFLVLFISTMTFALAESYHLLFIARSLQGLGSACSSVSGMGMLATYYVDDVERGKAFGFALSGLAMGVLIGPLFGGLMYQYTSKSVPFFILGSLALIDGFMQIVVLKPSIKPEDQKGASLKTLLRDPYILIAAASITFGNLGIATLEPSLPLWIKTTMKATRLEQGLVFLPCSLSYLMGTNVFGPIGVKIGRWLTTMIGMVIIGICLICIPFATTISHLIVPSFGMGFAIGMVDSSMMPIMGYLVDIRHVSVYGSVYAIADVAFCVGFAIGPSLSSGLVKAVGFRWMIWISAIICLIYTPFIIFLRNPPKKEESQSLMMNGELKSEYQTTGDPKKISDNSEPSNDLSIPIDKTVLSQGYGYGDD
uniref:Slc18a-4 n=1 Tax=Schmidtea mediterranea TaxID=79327 RepID=A0A0H3YJ83_SCHMD|nr:slc18a-4 [Schmidtea mediterranea]